MYSATQSSSLDLDMLDKKDLSNIKFQRVSEKTGREVQWSNIVKGYKLHNKYVVLTTKTLKQQALRKRR
jgi:DNA end-binding protein Ku